MSSVVKKAFSRLPGCVQPVHYTLRLKPDLEAFTFLGWIGVDLQVKSQTDRIVCNAAELTFDEIKLSNANDDPVTISSHSVCTEAETLTVTLPNMLDVGRYRLRCAFKGTLNDQLRGFYRSAYTAASGGEKRHCAVTQFEATDARRCFPCWDEPACKATFAISVLVPNDRTVHSNMPEVQVEENGDPFIEESSAKALDDKHRLVRFAKSPIMSTYLVALVVGEFEAKEKQTNSGIRVRAFTPMGKLEQGDFALETSIKALEFYTDFFGVPYPLPKYDCIAIPDFQCGAMENWGLVTYRESCILVDPENTSSSSRQWIAIVVNHEMAHQWFGNLVTMEWWTHLWLNEGFASFMENQCTSVLFPEFDIWTQFVSDTLVDALELDALKNSHPIEVEVGHPSEVDEIFDNISYNKGASIIRMLYDYIGKDAFRKGMKQYLEKYSYKNALTEQLWSSLEEASGKPVAEVMSTWTAQMGFPVVKVDKVEQDGDFSVISVSQEKFTADGKPVDEKFHWKVPINILVKGAEKSEQFLLTSEKDTIRIQNPKQGWIKLNHNFVGYFRVQYPPEYLATFHDDLRNKSLNELDRLSLLDDVMALVQASRLSTDVALELVKNCVHDEDSYVVWRCVNNFMAKLRVLLADDEIQANALNKFCIDIMSVIVDKIGWKPQPNEHHTKGLLRMMVLSRMGILGHEPTVKEAKRRFQLHVEGKELIPADLRAPVYRTVVANGGEEVFQQMVKLLKENDLHEEKDRLARAMGSFPTSDLLAKVLEFSFGEDVRSQDSPFVVMSVAANSKGRDLAWDFFKNKYDMLLERYKSGMLMSRLVKGTTDSFTTNEKADEIEEFFKGKENPAERTLRQSIESIKLNAQWLQRDAEVIKQFLAKQ